MRSQAIRGLKAGDSFTYSRTFSRAETLEFGRLTRDYNPVHYDRRWSAGKGMNGLICHGLLVGSMICELGGQVGWLAGGMDFKFIRPVYFDEPITCILTVTEVDEAGRARAEAVMVNQQGQEVIRAVLTGRLPLAEERALLQTMVDEGDPTNELRDGD